MCSKKQYRPVLKQMQKLWWFSMAVMLVTNGTTWIARWHFIGCRPIGRFEWTSQTYLAYRPGDGLYKQLHSRKILKFRIYEIASETNLGPIRCFLEAKRQSFIWMPFCPLRHTLLVSAFRLTAESHTLRRWSLRDSRNSSVALFAAISQVSTWYLCTSGRCVGVRQAIVNARQATSEWKSGPVETGLTGPATTALHSD